MNSSKWFTKSGEIPDVQARPCCQYAKRFEDEIHPTASNYNATSQSCFSARQTWEVSDSIRNLQEQINILKSKKDKLNLHMENLGNNIKSDAFDLSISHVNLEKSEKNYLGLNHKMKKDEELLKKMTSDTKHIDDTVYNVENRNYCNIIKQEDDQVNKIYLSQENLEKNLPQRNISLRRLSEDLQARESERYELVGQVRDQSNCLQISESHRLGLEHTMRQSTSSAQEYQLKSDVKQNQQNFFCIQQSINNLQDEINRGDLKIKSLETDFDEMKRKLENEMKKLKTEVLLTNLQLDENLRALNLRLTKERCHCHETLAKIECKLGKTSTDSESSFIHHHHHKPILNDHLKDSECENSLMEQILVLKQQLRDKEREMEHVTNKNYDLNQQLSMNDMEIQDLQYKIEILLNQLLIDTPASAGHMNEVEFPKCEEAARQLQLNDTPVKLVEQETVDDRNISQETLYNAELATRTPLYRVDLQNNKELTDLFTNIHKEAKKLMQQVTIIENIDKECEKHYSKGKLLSSEEMKEIDVYKNYVARKIQDLKKDFERALALLECSEAQTTSSASDDLTDYISMYKQPSENLTPN